MDSEIELIIYDLKGRMIDKLVSGLKEAGSHEISWNAEILASGVYFLKLIVGVFIHIQRLMFGQVKFCSFKKIGTS